MRGFGSLWTSVPAVSSCPSPPPPPLSLPHGWAHKEGPSVGISHPVLAPPLVSLAVSTVPFFHRGTSHPQGASLFVVCSSGHRCKSGNKKICAPPPPANKGTSLSPRGHQPVRWRPGVSLCCCSRVRWSRGPHTWPCSRPARVCCEISLVKPCAGSDFPSLVLTLYTRTASPTSGSPGECVKNADCQVETQGPGVRERGLGAARGMRWGGAKATTASSALGSTWSWGTCHPPPP